MKLIDLSRSAIIKTEKKIYVSFMTFDKEKCCKTEEFVSDRWLDNIPYEIRERAEIMFFDIDKMKLLCAVTK